MTNKIPDDVIEAMAKAAVDVSAEVSHMGVWADISADTKSILLAEQRAALAAAEAMGWKLVPREPTEEMLANTVDTKGTMRLLEFTTPDERSKPFLISRYAHRAMWDAAPSVKP